MAPELRHCYRFLQTLKKHPSAWPFAEPVDPVALGIPTYFDKIKEPMDFGTIEGNLGKSTTRRRRSSTPTSARSS